MQSRVRVSRREFLSQMTRAGLSIGAVTLGDRSWAAQPADQPSAPRNLRIGSSSKAVLGKNDFQYLGAFRLPSASGGIETSWGHALTHRYVAGQLSFFSTCSRVRGTPTSQVYEAVYPGHALSNYPEAEIARHWGDIYHGKRWNDVAGRADDGYVYGLYWDSVGGRLYWDYGDSYNASAGNNCCLGASTLNDSDGSSVAYGAWRMGSSRGCKMAQGGMVSIPSWFASQYTSNRRLAVGFGGRASAQSVGPSSDGPALAAIDPPTGPFQSDLPAYTVLCGYPCPDKYCKRPADYTDDIGGRGPWGDIGGWQWLDFIYQTGVWIDLPTKHGFMIMPFLGHGRIWYESSDIHSQRSKHWWFVIDPMDLASVAKRAKDQSDVVPVSWWEIQYPTYSYPLGPANGEPYQTALGATFDATTSRLYVMFPDQVTWQPTVAVYQVT